MKESDGLVRTYNDVKTVILTAQADVYLGCTARAEFMAGIYSD